MTIRQWLHLHLDRVPTGFRVAAVLFIVLRLAVLATVHNAFSIYDSAEYRLQPGGTAYPFVSLTGHAMRPFTVPLFYAVFPNDPLRMVAQVVLSIVAWLVLAVTVTLALRNRWVRAVAFGSVLLIGCSAYVTNWDFMILSESITISLAVLGLAAWIRFTRGPTALNSIVAVVVTVLFMFARPQMVPLVGIVAVVLAAWTWRPAARVLKLGVAAALALSVVWGIVVLQNVETTSATRNEAVGSFTENFVFVLQYRIIGDPEALQWFRDQGMPEPTGIGPAGDASVSVVESMQRFAAANPALETWITEHGQSTLLKYSIVRPDKFPAQFESELPGIFVPDRGAIVYAKVPTVLPPPIEWLLFPTNDTAPTQDPSLPPQVIFVALFAVALVIPRRRAVDRALLTTLIATLLVSAAGFYLAWVVSAMEPVRHAIPFTLLLPLSLLLGALTLVDAMVRDPAAPPVHPPDLAPATEATDTIDLDARDLPRVDAPWRAQR